MKQVLVDGYNLLLRTGRGWDEASREELLRDAALLAGERKATVVVFFDSRHGESRPVRSPRAGVRVEYCRHADAAILAALRSARSARGIAVVTEDRPLAAEARALGATILDTAGFTARRTRRRRPRVRPEATGKPASASASEVEAWLRIFSDPSRENEPDW